jgi:KDO2-lipid IV(A) lauroyltransferase
LTEPLGIDRHRGCDSWRARLEAAPLCALWTLARWLPRRLAARLCGAFFATLGPLTRKQRHVKRNLSFVKPAAEPAEINRLARAVWRNFGRVLAEFPHLDSIVAEDLRVEFAPETRALLDAGKPITILTAHLGNWEVLGAWLAEHGPPLTAVYDRNDNPILERRIQHYRRADRIRFTDKEASLRELLAASRQGRSIALLQDTRVDTGAMLPLFGVAAATTISPAKIARRFGYPLVPVQVVRLPDQGYLLRFHAPLVAPETDDERAAATDLTQQYHRLLEGWIAAQPGQWLCTKRRWPKTAVPAR